MITVEHVSKRLGGHVVLHDVSLHVARSETVAILGPSGCGKSTLLRCINHLAPPDSGRVTVGDVTIEGPGPFPRERQRQLRLRVGMVFQQFHLFPHLDALGNVAVAPIHVRGLGPEAARALAREWLGRVGLADRAHHLPSQLSGGQQQRVAIARALAMQPDALLLDEPTSALDPGLRGEVAEVLRSLAESGATMLLVTHDLRLARETAGRVLVMNEGRMVEEGPAAEMLDRASR